MKLCIFSIYLCVLCCAFAKLKHIIICARDERKLNVGNPIRELCQADGVEIALGKPFPVKNCTLTNQTSNSVEIFCLSGFDGGLPQHFLLELYTNDIMPRYNISSFTEPYFYLDNLEPDVTFRLAVFAVNSKGRSTPVVFEGVTLRDAEKRTASDGDFGFSPALGILTGAVLTVIVIIIFVIVRLRRGQNRQESPVEEKNSSNLGHHQNTLSSTKPLLRSTSPRELDERDPDVIPAKYGSPEDDNHDRLILTSAIPTTEDFNNTSMNNYPNVPAPQWVSPVSTAPLEQYHQYNNPVAMVGTFPRDSRPKDLRLGNGNTTATLTRVADVELNGLAIKERLMANRLPESCV